MRCCNGCQLQSMCKTLDDMKAVEEIWNKEPKYYWWYITNSMRKVVYMGELQKDHTERCTGAKLIRIQ